MIYIYRFKPLFYNHLTNIKYHFKQVRYAIDSLCSPTMIDIHTFIQNKAKNKQETNVEKK